MSLACVSSDFKEARVGADGYLPALIKINGFAFVDVK